MHTWLEEVRTALTPESLFERLPERAGGVLLRSGGPVSASARWSLVAARPFLTFRCRGRRCELTSPGPTPERRTVYGNPWEVLAEWLARYELPRELDLPLPLGGCFGFWGYELKRFIEPRLRGRSTNDLGLPDCQVGFYDSLVAFDHVLGRAWILSTGLDKDGSRRERRAREQSAFWRSRFEAVPRPRPVVPAESELRVCANLTRADFLRRVTRAQAWIRSGDIYQVNLSQRLAVEGSRSAWDLFRRLSAVSPAPLSAYYDGDDFQLVSSSPELFLRLSGAQVETRPIKGTRPRSPDPARDAELARELQRSAKEAAELVMITDLLRNDLGRVCEFGSVQVPKLLSLERYPQVQHLVSTVTGRLRPEVSHLAALAACFPGGSITGAPKFRAMEIIDALEPAARGPYTGALGYLGFNRESQLSILIRTAVCTRRATWFQVGAGIVADSDPAAEYEETLAKAAGFLEALRCPEGIGPEPSAEAELHARL